MRAGMLGLDQIGEGREEAWSERLKGSLGRRMERGAGADQRQVVQALIPLKMQIPWEARCWRFSISNCCCGKWKI